MSFNILEAAKGYITPDLIAKASSFLGENESSSTKAITGILPTILSGLVSKASDGGTGAFEVMNMAKDSAQSNMLGNIGGLFSGGNLMEKGVDLVKGLFGNKLGSIVSMIASYAGIKNTSASTLFSMVAPIAAGVLGKHAVENNLDASGLASMLGKQKSSILSMLPSGLSGIASTLGLGNIGGHVADTAKATANYAGETAKKGMNWLTWFLPLLLAAALIWWFLLGGKNGCGNATATTDTISVVKTEDTAAKFTPPVIVKDRESLMVKLPNGTELSAYKGGIEDQLVTFLGTNWAGLGEDSLKKIWFDFDNLNFNTGSAVITDESQAQVNNLVAILKAFPKAKLKIGGYTDKTGSEDANKKLSKERATAVQAALTKGGVGTQVTGAEGYGSDFATYPAEAPETDRVKDRHVSVSVRG